MKQNLLFDKEKDCSDINQKAIGHNLSLIFSGENQETVGLYFQNDILLKKINLSDKVEKRLFVIECIDRGAIQTHLAKALDISRQTIHNYLETKKHFGLEGLINNYTPSKSKSLGKQRELNKNKLLVGNTAEQLIEIRQAEIKERESKQLVLFNFEKTRDTLPVEKEEDKLFSENHPWEETRYAGVFAYIPILTSEWRWISLVIGLFGEAYKIFMIFILMAARNIRSIEQLKNVRSREAGVVLGIKDFQSKEKVWTWFYAAATKRKSLILLKEYFQYQIRVGIVVCWILFSDGHLLPYTGKEKVHYSYNTQRRMPVPGQTNMVTCDGSGRIVFFEIQEGKGDLKQYILDTKKNWKGIVPECVVHVFDREGSGTEYFSKMVRGNSAFVTWEKNIDSKKLAELDDALFDKELEFNGKIYKIFEKEKSFTFKPAKDSDEKEHTFILREIYIWNKSSNRRVCGLAWSGEEELSIEDCVRAILNRWGASENTFKHIKERHPLHYHPGFSKVKSEKQDIANPEIKVKGSQIARIKKDLGKLYKKIAKVKIIFNKDGSARKNNVKVRLEEEIIKKEQELATLQEEKRELPERVDPSKLENYRSIKKIDNEGKNLFDFVTSSVWNARKQMVDWIQPLMVGNENELVDLFYTITYCHGWIKSTQDKVIVRLEPLQQNKRRAVQEFLCRKLTSLGARIPGGKLLILEVGESPFKKKCPKK